MKTKNKMLKNTEKQTRIQTKAQKRAQQEIVGFVIIIVLVLVIGTIFLGIYLRQKHEIPTTDAEIKNFLIASSKYTTDCYKNEETKYKTLGDLVVDCYKSRDCSDGRTACSVVSKTYSEILNRTWTASAGGVVNYYKMSFYYSEFIDNWENDKAVIDEEQQETPKIALLGLADIVEGAKGSCLDKRAGQNTISFGEGDMITELEICKNE